MPDAPFSRICARFSSTGMQRMTTAASYPSSIDAKSAYATVRQSAASTQPARAPRQQFKRRWGEVLHSPNRQTDMTSSVFSPKFLIFCKNKSKNVFQKRKVGKSLVSPTRLFLPSVLAGPKIRTGTLYCSNQWRLGRPFKRLH